MIIFLILITFSFDDVLILLGEILFWSLLEIKGLIGNWFCVRLVLFRKIRLLRDTFFSFSTVMNSNYFAFNSHGFGCYIIMYNSPVIRNTANQTQRDFYEEVDLLTKFRFGNCASRRSFKIFQSFVIRGEIGIWAEEKN